MRRVITRLELMVLDGIGAIGCCDRDAIECLRAIFNAPAVDGLEIGGGIAVLPNAIHAFGIVSYK